MFFRNYAINKSNQFTDDGGNDKQQIMRPLIFSTNKQQTVGKQKENMKHSLANINLNIRFDHFQSKNDEQIER